MSATKTKVPPKKTANRKPAAKTPVVVETDQFQVANSHVSPRMTAIHLLWDILQAGPVSKEQLAQKIAASLVKANKMKADDAMKLANQSIAHQLPYETGQKGRKTIRVKETKGKLTWVGGAVRRRSA